MKKVKKQAQRCSVQAPQLYNSLEDRFQLEEDKGIQFEKMSGFQMMGKNVFQFKSFRF